MKHERDLFEAWNQWRLTCRSGALYAIEDVLAGRLDAARSARRLLRVMVKRRDAAERAWKRAVGPRLVGEGKIGA